MPELDLNFFGILWEPFYRSCSSGLLHLRGKGAGDLSTQWLESLRQCKECRSWQKAGSLRSALEGKARGLGDHQQHQFTDLQSTDPDSGTHELCVTRASPLNSRCLNFLKLWVPSRHMEMQTKLIVPLQKFRHLLCIFWLQISGYVH